MADKRANLNIKFNSSKDKERVLELTKVVKGLKNGSTSSNIRAEALEIGLKKMLHEDNYLAQINANAKSLEEAKELIKANIYLLLSSKGGYLQQNTNGEVDWKISGINHPLVKNTFKKQSWKGKVSIDDE